MATATIKSGDTVWAIVKAELQKSGAPASDSDVAAATKKVLDANNLTWDSAKKMSLGDTVDLSVLGTDNANAGTGGLGDNASFASGTGNTTVMNQAGAANSNAADPQSLALRWNQLVERFSLGSMPVTPSGLAQSILTSGAPTIDAVSRGAVPTSFSQSAIGGAQFGQIVSNLGGRDILAQRGFFV